MAGMPNLKAFSQSFGLQNVQVGGDRVAAGFDPPPATPAPAPASVAAPVPSSTSTANVSATSTRRRRAPATILGAGDSADTLG